MAVNWAGVDTPVIARAGLFQRKKIDGYFPDDKGVTATLSSWRTLCVEYTLADTRPSASVEGRARACIYWWELDNSLTATPDHVLPNPESVEQVKAWGNLIMAAEGYRPEYE